MPSSGLEKCFYWYDAPNNYVGIIVVRLLTRDQALREIRSFEKFHCGPTEALAMNRISDEEFERWTSLLHALGAYKEGEGIEVSVEENFTIKSLRKVLTEKRIRLLEQIGLGATSITELAKRTGQRDMKNVYEDLQMLRRLGFVALEKDGRRVVPRLLLSSIRFDFR